MSIRPATEADVAAIVEIYNDVILTSDAIWLDEVVSYEDRLHWFRGEEAAGHPVIVAVDGDDQVLGYGCLGPFRSKSGYWPSVEHSIHVAELHRGEGTGQALLDELVDLALKAGKQVMIAGIDAGNLGSIRFHQRNGFRTVADMPGVGRKFGRPVDLILMQREIQ